ncbi:hypothetical protein CI102_6079 [Trichoderma harzianum]|nr:hypothetical protein CI102_6079 [Trichoderma harzianum]
MDRPAKASCSVTYMYISPDADTQNIRVHTCTILVRVLLVFFDNYPSCANTGSKHGTDTASISGILVHTSRPLVQGLKSAYSQHSRSVHLLLSLLRTTSKIKMSWHHVFVIGNISRRVCGLHLCQGVPRISFRPIKPLHMRNEDCHASSYSRLSVFPAALYHSRGQALYLLFLE